MNQQFKIKKDRKIGVTKALMGHLCSPIVMTIVTHTHTFTREGAKEITPCQTNQYLGNHWIQTNFPFCYHFFVFRLSCSGSLISFPCFFSPWLILLNAWFFSFFLLNFKTFFSLIDQIYSIICDLNMWNKQDFFVSSDLHKLSTLEASTRVN
jgi:hypothetical protein